MKSLIQRHRSNVQASRAQAGASSGKALIAAMPKAASGLMGSHQTAELLDKALAEDLAALKALASFERKAEFKRATLVPRYRASVQRLMQGGKPHRGIAYFMVWCFDTGLIAEGLELGLWCIEHDQALPDGFKSSVPFFVASQVAEWAEGEFKLGHDFEPYLGQTLAALGAGGWNVDDETTARFYRLPGLKAMQDGNYAEAVTQLEKALALGAQVTTKFAEARKKLEKAGGEAPKAQ